MVKDGQTANNIVLSPVLPQHNLRASISTHRLNRQAIIRDVPSDLSRDEIIFNLCSLSHKLLKVDRLNRKIIKSDKSTELVPSNSALLTFDGQNLPSHVYIFYVTYEVNVYVPQTKMCYNCFRFVHLKIQC